MELRFKSLVPEVTLSRSLGKGPWPRLKEKFERGRTVPILEFNLYHLSYRSPVSPTLTHPREEMKVSGRRDLEPAEYLRLVGKRHDAGWAKGCSE